MLSTVGVAFPQQPHDWLFLPLPFPGDLSFTRGWFSHGPFDRCGTSVLPDSRVRKEILALSQSFEAQNRVLACDTVETVLGFSAQRKQPSPTPSSHNKVTRMRAHTHRHTDFVLLRSPVQGWSIIIHSGLVRVPRTKQRARA